MSYWLTSLTRCSKTWKSRTKYRQEQQEAVILTICKEVRPTYCTHCWTLIPHLPMIPYQMRVRMRSRASIIRLRIKNSRMGSTKTRTQFSWIKIRQWRSSTLKIPRQKWCQVTTKTLSMAKLWKSISIRMAPRAKQQLVNIILVLRPYSLESQRNLI